MRILGISGSIRKGSSNTALLFAAKSIAPQNVSFEIHPNLGDLPHFNTDLDGEGSILPPEVQRLRREIAASSALLISTPEYAHGIPGVLKNALDWLVSDVNFPGKPVGILFGSASDSSFAKTALIEVLKTMSAHVIPEAVISIQGARVKFDPSGNLMEAQTSVELLRAVNALVEASKPT